MIRTRKRRVEPRSGYRFSEKIMLNEKPKARC